MILVIYATVLIVFLIDIFRWGITPNSTSKRTREEILNILPTTSGKMADLGSGFGDFANFLAVKAQKEITCFEGALLPYYVSKLLLLVKKKQENQAS